MGIPKFRLCDHCESRGVEERIGTADAPMVQITIGVLDGGLSYDARLPRWAWALWTRFQAGQKSGDDGVAGELEPVPLKWHLCRECAQAMLTAPDAHEVISQRQRRDECRVKAAQEAAELATARAAALAARR